MLPSLPLLVVSTTDLVADHQRMTSPGVVALACVRCENGYSVLPLSHLRAEPMSKEQLDAVRDQLMSDDHAVLRQSIYRAFLEDAERGANMIIAFAKEKGLQFDASTEDVVQAMNTMDDEDIDFEMTPEMLASVSGRRCRDT